jgi:hypothetical protein
MSFENIYWNLNEWEKTTDACLATKILVDCLTKLKQTGLVFTVFSAAYCRL